MDVKNNNVGQDVFRIGLKELSRNKFKMLKHTSTQQYVVSSIIALG